MSTAPQREKDAYEAIRQQLREVAKKQPWILEITVAEEGNPCQHCNRKTTIEHPSGQFRCTSCHAKWVEVDMTRSRARSWAPIGRMVV